ncbi:hypothetical protein [Oscillatoria acuminata]|uniref:Uncharacterized protein n=1 Tax=Oscillatoria acuminata PCC 6304 TaxID=56110 RepID=K9TIS8_9CYAN|nr:hypothetical protein [Oscillatoria acuminata]AFY82455.1 hypothetical protein Oscil6304_2853 [Oscillatoria acuminata PCC 6304]
MSETEDNEKFFTDDDFSKGKLFIDIPSNSPSPYIERIPYAFDPMEEILARGMAFRGLSGGNGPGIILIFSWIIFGAIPLMLLILIIALGDYSLVPTFLVSTLFIVILVRGTKAKLSRRRTSTRRRRRIRRRR